jgi:hypothetical protein
VTGRHRLGVTATVVAVVLWAVGSTLAKKVDLTGEVLSLHRIGWAALLYLAVLTVRRNRPTRATLRLALWAGIAYALTNVLFFVGIKSTTHGRRGAQPPAGAGHGRGPRPGGTAGRSGSPVSLKRSSPRPGRPGSVRW